MNTRIDSLIGAVIDGRMLNHMETVEVFDALVAGRIPDDRIEACLIALADRGESVDEIVGAAQVMRRCVTPIACESANAIDTCGTGGDGISTFNVSTAAALVAAGAGAIVAKHGNRSNSRASGSAEVLTALGVNIDAPPAVVERCLREIGIGFLFAPKLHPAMARVASIRRRIGRPTIFNLLGPLTNPAGVRRQIIGVPRPDLVDKLAAVLAQLGAVHAFVVHGHDGLCDLTISSESTLAEVRPHSVTVRTIAPEDVNFPRAGLDKLRVSSPADSAAVINGILNGEPGPPRHHTLLNAAVALVAAGVAADFKDGVARAARAIDSGAARDKLNQLVKCSGGLS